MFLGRSHRDIIIISWIFIAISYSLRGIVLNYRTKVLGVESWQVRLRACSARLDWRDMRSDNPERGTHPGASRRRTSRRPREIQKAFKRAFKRF